MRLSNIYIGIPVFSILFSPLAHAQFDPLRGAPESNLSTISFFDLLLTIMQYGLGILTVLAIIGFVISGIIFIVAGGAGGADAARKWLVYSIVGIVVGLIGYIVIRLIYGLTIGVPEID